MKKFLAAAVAAVMALGVMTGCSSTSEEPAENNEATEEGAEAGERTTFTVGFDAEYPPYGYMAEDGSYVGFDLDLAQEVCDRNGWELVKQPVDWNSKDMELNSGSIDCIWNGFTMTGREDKYTFSVPYVDNSIVFIVMNDSDIQTAEDLAGKVVVTQADSSALAALTSTENNEENLALKDSFAELQEVPDYNSAFLNLEDCIAVDIGVAQYQLTSRGDTFRKLEKPLSTEQYGIGFKKGNEELRDAVQEKLFEMYEDGTFQKIAEKYAEYNIPEMICIERYMDGGDKSDKE